MNERADLICAALRAAGFAVQQLRDQLCWKIHSGGRTSFLLLTYQPDVNQWRVVPQRQRPEYFAVGRIVAQALAFYQLRIGSLSLMINIVAGLTVMSLRLS